MMTDEQLQEIYPEWASLHESSRAIIREQANGAAPVVEIIAEELLGLLDGRLVRFAAADGTEVVLRALVRPQDKLDHINRARAKMAEKGIGDGEPLTVCPPNLLQITGPLGR